MLPNNPVNGSDHIKNKVKTQIGNASLKTFFVWERGFICSQTS